MLLRKKPGGFYTYPDHYHGPSGVVRKLLWRLGFDFLTVYERLRQVDKERNYWKQLAGGGRPLRLVNSGESSGNTTSFQIGQESND